MYCKMTKLTNLRGRIDYISNEQRQENILAYEQSFSKDDVNRLVKEQHENFKEYNKYKNAKCTEGREIHFPIKHDYIKNEKQAKEVATALVDYFKNKYKVECSCAIHLTSRGKNLHAHMIFFDREKLKNPIIREEKRATRTRYFDENWKRTTKAKAVHIQKKGDIIEPGKEIYFGNKKQEFYSKGFLSNLKKDLANQLNYTEFDSSRHFATKHIGKHNPKKRYIEEYNNVVMNINNYFDQLEQIVPEEEREGRTPKNLFQGFLRTNQIKKLSTEVMIEQFESFTNVVKEAYYDYEKEIDYLNKKTFNEDMDEETEDIELE